MTPIEKVLSRLPGHRTTGDGFKACCPSHEDRNPSLSIREADDGTVLLKCFGGCPTDKATSLL
jgi:DNA primase